MLYDVVLPLLDSQFYILYLYLISFFIQKQYITLSFLLKIITQKKYYLDYYCITLTRIPLTPIELKLKMRRLNTKNVKNIANSSANAIDI